MAAATSSVPEKLEGSEKPKEKPTEKPTEKPVDLAEAVNLLAQGKRNMLCGEIPDAVNQLQEACRLMAKQYGEIADECGEAYYCYGKALLDLSRMESGVLGQALKGIDSESEEESSEDKSEKSSEDSSEKMSEEDKEKLSTEIIDAMTEREVEKEKEKPTENGHDEKKEEKKEGEEEKKEGEKEEEMETEEAKNLNTSALCEWMHLVVNLHVKPVNTVNMVGEDGDAASEDIADEEGEEEGKEGEEEGTEEEGTEGEAEAEGKEGETAEAAEPGTSDGKQEVDEDEVSNLQLAWEMLELAKMIFSKSDTKASKMKLAESHLKLGEVGLETEQYETAISDFKECLRIQKENLDAENRCLAETYYQLGLACTYHGLYDDAVSNYKHAAKVIESKIDQLNKVIEDGEKEGKGKDLADFEDPVVQACKEIKELKEILPDIFAKIEDVEDEKKSSDTVKKMVKENVQEIASGTTTVGFGDTAKPAAKPVESKPADITHLVRKKRKTDEGPEGEEDSKKAKTEELNGSGDAKPKQNGTTVNGTAAPAEAMT